jgi:NAD(P)-dependent dehydrogenase (short-subunit alcohol dehydrogenase family)
MAGKFENKVAVITGASRGIGRAIAMALAKEGAIIVANARRKAPLDELVKDVEELNGRIVAVQGDVTNEEDVKTLHNEVIGQFGHCDILINNVGVGKYGPVKDFSVDDYDWIMKANMRSTFLVTRAFLPEMLDNKSGSIIFISSVAGLRGLPNEAVYCASKCAQVGFAQSLDYETRPHGVKVSVIAPGATKTDFAFGTGRTPGDPKLDEYSDPEDVAESVLFVLSQPEKTRVMLVSMRPMVEAL